MDYYKYEKPIIITFDDGYENNFKNAFPILEEYRIKSTIFLISSKIDTKNFLTKDHLLKKDEIQQMALSNLISFQGHTVSHKDLTTIEDKEIMDELEQSNKIIESITGSSVEVLAYPYGSYSDNIIKKICTNNYYKYCVIGGNMPYVYSHDLKSNYKIPRIMIKRSDTLQDFINKINK